MYTLVFDMARTANDMEAMRRVLDGYDSSADYWKLTANGGLEYDKEGWLKKEDGSYFLDNNGNKIGDKGIKTGLIKILGLDPSKAEYVKRVQDMMTAAGLGVCCASRLKSQKSAI